LEETVVFAGWVKNAATALLPAADIYFQPSLWEAMSIAILEAMAAGRPIVATRVGEAPFMIEDGVDGLLAAPRDVSRMAEQLCRLIESPTLRRSIGEAAGRKAADRYTIAKMARAYERMYLDAMGRAAEV
jgi:glycosyltransferase involved in cell wall biosynthesis